jgi:hypothetical protein
MPHFWTHVCEIKVVDEGCLRCCELCLAAAEWGACSRQHVQPVHPVHVSQLLRVFQLCGSNAVYAGQHNT